MSVVSSYSASSYLPSSPQSRLSLAGQSLSSLPEDLERRVLEEGIEELNLAQNRLSPLSAMLGSLTGLRKLDVSDNGLLELPEELCQLKRLEVLIVKKNSLNSLPNSFAQLRSSLLELNASGNLLEKFPPQIVCLTKLESLHLGGNRLRTVPRSIGQLKELSNLYLGGNRLQEVPPELGELHKLSALILCDNQLQSIPPQLAQLTCLTSLQLHQNQLQTLPKGLTQLVALRELSLLDNPLVNQQSIREWANIVPSTVPSLLELSARALLKEGVPHQQESLPGGLTEYLQNARHCDNLACNGVYFQSHVQSVTFGEFCGEYSVPFMEYLCSPVCATVGVEDSSCRGNGVASSEEEEKERDTHSVVYILYD